jgi:hypothetical protein
MAGRAGIPGIYRLMNYGSQLMVAGRRNNGFRGFFPCGTVIKGVKNRGTNEDGEEKGYNIHADTEKEWLPAADSDEL